MQENLHIDNYFVDNKLKFRNIWNAYHQNSHKFYTFNTGTAYRLCFHGVGFYEAFDPDILENNFLFYQHPSSLP